MSVSYLPFDQDSESCERFYIGFYKPLLERQSKQMVKMNSTLTIFTSWTTKQIDCRNKYFNKSAYPGIVERAFSADALLRKFRFSSKQIDWIKNWHSINLDQMTTIPKKYRSLTIKRAKKIIEKEHKKHAAARLSDLWRLLLAREHQMAYLDLDMFPVVATNQLYLGGANVAVPIWGIEKGALEIQNSGFCFTSRQLDLLIQRATLIMDSKGGEQDYELYTELAPTRFLFTTCNDDASPIKVLDKVAIARNEIYWLHLDGRFRRAAIGSDIDNIRQALDYVFEKMNPSNPQEVLPQFTWLSK
mmetsp:Transcript_2958/g.4456  ORF Transcript_2958/g.4456 Transcript_2958/m.4456 type:complete len:302 (-) Transcript_2958:41-946(-)